MTKQNLDVEKQVIKTKKPYMGALLCLLIVIGATIGMKVGAMFLDNSIAELENTIARNENQIQTLQDESSLLQVSHLIKQNTAILAKLEKGSDVVNYIEHLGDISRQYNISMSGFEYSGETVGTTVLSRSGIDSALAYVNVVKFLKEYEQNNNALFTLSYIESISGHDSMKFALNFLIK